MVVFFLILFSSHSTVFEVNSKKYKAKQKLVSKDQGHGNNKLKKICVKRKVRT